MGREKKKIGIMTMHRVENYGSFLQAYGLSRMIRGLGLETEFVDYENGESLVPKQTQIWMKIRRNINLVEALKKKKIKNEFEEKYREKFLPILEVKEKMNLRPQNIDTLVIGSDEVFNPVQPTAQGYAKELFGLHYEKTPVISYAACFGYCKMGDLEKYGIKTEIGEMLDKFKAVSVRDENSFEIVKSISHQEPVINLDPVLMYDFTKEYQKSHYDLKDYIVLYVYPGRFTKAEEKEIVRLARKHHKKIVSVGFYQKIADECIVPDVFEIFDVFKKADFVITDTFHGTIFSVKGEVKFCSIIRDTHSNKLGDLLGRIGLLDRKMENPEELEKLFATEIDYKKTNQILERERKKATKYLEENL